MNFRIVDPPLKDEFLFQLQSDDDKIILGIRPVVFGYRVSARKNSDPSGYYVDYCMANDQLRTWLTLYMMHTIFVQNYDHPNIWSLFPRQDRKPFYNDSQQYLRFLAEFNKCDVFPLTYGMFDLHPLKEQFYIDNNLTALISASRNPPYSETDEAQGNDQL